MKCRCGGTMQRIDIRVDIEASRRYGRQMFIDTDPVFSNWRCSRCSETQRRRKRRSQKQDSQALSQAILYT